MFFRAKGLVYRSVCVLIAYAIFHSGIVTDLFKANEAFANDLNTPMIGSLLQLSQQFDLPVLRGIKYDVANPFQMDFIIDQGDNAQVSDEQAAKLVRYFLTALTVPEDKLWVNLSPYEAERIIDDSLLATETGETLLKQDYLLKQLSASLTYPETQIGQKYWNGISGMQNASAALNKIWISTDKVELFDGADTVFIKDAILKVQTEADYHDSTQSDKSSDVIRDVLLPEIERDVNNGKNFAPLRQLYHSAILAQWFKKKFSESLFKFYYNSQKVVGVDNANPLNKETVFNRYVEAFEKGAYNYTRKEKIEDKIIKKNYFSGGSDLLLKDDMVTKVNSSSIFDQFNQREIDLPFTVYTGSSQAKFDDGTVDMDEIVNGPSNLMDSYDEEQSDAEEFEQADQLDQDLSEALDELDKQIEKFSSSVDSMDGGSNKETAMILVDLVRGIKQEVALDHKKIMDSYNSLRSDIAKSNKFLSYMAHLATMLGGITFVVVGLSDKHYEISIVGLVLAIAAITIMYKTYNGTNKSLIETRDPQDERLEELNMSLVSFKKQAIISSMSADILNVQKTEQDFATAAYALMAHVGDGNGFDIFKGASENKFFESIKRGYFFRRSKSYVETSSWRDYLIEKYEGEDLVNEIDKAIVESNNKLAYIEEFDVKQSSALKEFGNITTRFELLVQLPKYYPNGDLLVLGQSDLKEQIRSEFNAWFEEGVQNVYELALLSYTAANLDQVDELKDYALKLYATTNNRQLEDYADIIINSSKWALKDFTFYDDAYKKNPFVKSKFLKMLELMRLKQHYRRTYSEINELDEMITDVRSAINNMPDSDAKTASSNILLTVEKLYQDLSDAQVDNNNWHEGNVAAYNNAFTVFNSGMAILSLATIVVTSLGMVVSGFVDGELGLGVARADDLLSNGILSVALGVVLLQFVERPLFHRMLKASYIKVLKRDYMTLFKANIANAQKSKEIATLVHTTWEIWDEKSILDIYESLKNNPNSYDLLDYFVENKKDVLVKENWKQFINDDQLLDDINKRVKETMASSINLEDMFEALEEQNSVDPDRSRLFDDPSQMTEDDLAEDTFSSSIVDDAKDMYRMLALRKSVFENEMKDDAEGMTKVMTIIRNAYLASLASISIGLLSYIPELNVHESISKLALVSGVAGGLLGAMSHFSMSKVSESMRNRDAYRYSEDIKRLFIGELERSITTSKDIAIMIYMAWDFLGKDTIGLLVSQLYSGIATQKIHDYFAQEDHDVTNKGDWEDFIADAVLLDELTLYKERQSLNDKVVKTGKKLDKISSSVEQMPEGELKAISSRILGIAKNMYRDMLKVNANNEVARRNMVGDIMKARYQFGNRIALFTTIVAALELILGATGDTISGTVGLGLGLYIITFISERKFINKSNRLHYDVLRNEIANYFEEYLIDYVRNSHDFALLVYMAWEFVDEADMNSLIENLEYNPQTRQLIDYFEQPQHDVMNKGHWENFINNENILDQLDEYKGEEREFRANELKTMASSLSLYLYNIFTKLFDETVQNKGAHELNYNIIEFLGVLLGAAGFASMLANITSLVNDSGDLLLHGGSYAMLIGLVVVAYTELMKKFADKFSLNGDDIQALQRRMERFVDVKHIKSDLDMAFIAYFCSNLGMHDQVKELLKQVDLSIFNMEKLVNSISDYDDFEMQQRELYEDFIPDAVLDKSDFILAKKSSSPVEDWGPWGSDVDEHSVQANFGMKDYEGPTLTDQDGERIDPKSYLYNDKYDAESRSEFSSSVVLNELNLIIADIKDKKAAKDTLWSKANLSQFNQVEFTPQEKYDFVDALDSSLLHIETVEEFAISGILLETFAHADHFEYFIENYRSSDHQINEFVKKIQANPEGSMYHYDFWGDVLSDQTRDMLDMVKKASSSLEDYELSDPEALQSKLMLDFASMLNTKQKFVAIGFLSAFVLTMLLLEHIHDKSFNITDTNSTPKQKIETQIDTTNTQVFNGGIDLKGTLDDVAVSSSVAEIRLDKNTIEQIKGLSFRFIGEARHVPLSKILGVPATI